VRQTTPWIFELIFQVRLGYVTRCDHQELIAIRKCFKLKTTQMRGFCLLIYRDIVYLKILFAMA